MEEKNKKYRVWWVRNPPAKGEYFYFSNLRSAKEYLKVLSKQDLKNKLITANAGGVQKKDEEGEWMEVDE